VKALCKAVIPVILFWHLLDHGNPPKPIKRAGIHFSESFCCDVRSANLADLPVQQENGESNEIVLVDQLALGQQQSALPEGSYILRQQTSSVTFTGATVRVNCLDCELTDVTVTDVTDSQGVTCVRHAQ